MSRETNQSSALSTQKCSILLLQLSYHIPVVTLKSLTDDYWPANNFFQKQGCAHWQSALYKGAQQYVRSIITTKNIANLYLKMTQLLFTAMSWENHCRNFCYKSQHQCPPSLWQCNSLQIPKDAASMTFINDKIEKGCNMRI